MQYCADSEQCINLQKSFIMINPNVPAEWIGYLEDLFNIHSSSKFWKYLGSSLDIVSAKIEFS